MTFHSKLGLGIVVALTLPTISVAQEKDREQFLKELPAPLQKALRDSSKLRFSGERKIEFREGPQRIRQTEYVLKNGSQLRIEFGPDSPNRGQVIVENGGRREHYFPNLNEIQISAPKREEVLVRLVQSIRMALKDKGKFSVVDGGSIAGYETDRVDIKDGRGNRFQSLWIESKSGLILKRELYDRVGSVMGAFEYVRVDFTPTLRASDFEIRRQGAKRVTAQDVAARSMKEHDFARVFLTEDANLILDGHRVLGPKQDTLVLFYQTPRGILSFIQYRGDDRRPDPRMGPGRRLSRYQFQLSGRTFILLGEMSEDELRRIAQKAQVR